MTSGRSTITGMNDLGVLPHVVESIVNHVSGEAKKGVAGTYNKPKYLKERTVALQVWADHITGAPETKVVELPRTRLLNVVARYSKHIVRSQFVDGQRDAAPLGSDP